MNGLIPLAADEAAEVLSAVALQKRNEEDEERFGGMMSVDCVGSSCFQLIRYDSFTKTLWMRFQEGNGTVYQWEGVPLGKIKAFREASSKGKFYWSQIQGRYLTNYTGSGPKRGK